MTSPLPHRIFTTLHRRAGMFVGAVLALTALLAVPVLTMAPTESASTEPAGPVFTARDRIADSFAPAVRQTVFIAESAQDDLLGADLLRADLLRAEPLQQLLAAQKDLRSDPEVGPTLAQFFNPTLNTTIHGPFSLAELVDNELRAQGASLATATDADVKAAAATVIDRVGPQTPLLGLSSQSTRDSNGDWIVPALNVIVFSDNDKLGFGAQAINLGGNVEPEEYDRSLQTILRRAEGVRVHGVAIDVNLTSQEQGAIAGPFIGLTILAVLLVAGATFRSYWVVATISVALVAQIIWLKGISNLVGLKDDLILSIIVPIAMISFGIDFAFHAIGRYREERAAGHRADVASVVSLSRVSGALLLALGSSVAAFLSNVVSGIESIVQFGIGAAVALVSAWLLLGITTPLVVARLEAIVPPPTDSVGSTALRLFGSVAIAALAMAASLMLVFVLPWLGIVLAAMALLVGLIVPAFVQRRRLAGDPVGSVSVSEAASALTGPIADIVGTTARWPRTVVGLALCITAIAAMFAVRVPAEFDVNDFFSPDTDFVVGLDQLDTHVGERGGEQAVLYVEGNLTDPEALATLQSHVTELRRSDTALLARDSEGIAIDGGIFSVFEATWASPVMADLVAQRTSVILTDSNADSIPDTTQQIQALLTVGASTGVPLDEQRLLLTPDEVENALVSTDTEDRTSFGLNVVNSRDQQSVLALRELIEPISDQIAADLGGTFVQVTGSPFVRESSLAGTNRALQTSLPIAIALCLLISTAALRSIRWGLASVVPIVLVVAWLYGFMEIAGYAINIVTATIAAVSIGIGIDFAIHFIARYTEELHAAPNPIEAIRATAAGTGVALLASAFSSALGFAVLAFAPMPLFASYGLLTALMIAMAVTATLLVLPSLLVLVTRDSDVRSASETPASAGACG